MTACGATCLAADVAAKAGFLAGDLGPAWLDARGIPARFVGVDGGVLTNDPWERQHAGGRRVHLTSSPVDWYAARAGGIVAYVLLSVNVALGAGDDGQEVDEAMAPVRAGGRASIHGAC